MIRGATPDPESRVLVLAPRGRDADVVGQLLTTFGLRCEPCADLPALVTALAFGADIALLTEEALAGPELALLVDWIDRQPPWSDFPFVVLATRRVGRRPLGAAATLRDLGNVVLLERPLNTDTLVSAARAAMRARRRQYATRTHMAAELAARASERQANAETLAVKQAFEVALEAGELGTFHCPFPLARVEANAVCRTHFWMNENDESTLANFLARVHRDDLTMTELAIERSVTGSVPYDIDHRTVSPTGAVRWIRVKGRVYRDAGGEPVRFDGVTLDIDRQKRLEDERETLLAGERAARLEAERAGRMKDEFLATLSHELRTPLSAIIGWTHLLSRPGASAADVAKASTIIERNAKAQARLIEDLLDVSRITSGNLELEATVMQLGPVLDAVMQALKPAAEAKRVALAVQVEPQRIEMVGDAQRIQQVLWNLVSNAVKFTPAGGRVAVRAKVAAADVVLEVQDNGAGISPEFLPHVFERFRQEQSTSSRSFGGLGLGLAIVRQLVELHGGSVRATSPGTGLGSTFAVRLPIGTDAAHAPGDPDRPPPDAIPRSGTDPLAGLHIVLIEDEADGRDMLTRMLEREGARVTALDSAEQALLLLQRMSPDLLISDIGMPSVDGHELIRRVRADANPSLQQLPAIALTAFAHPSDAGKARAAGFQRHLPKPVNPEALLNAIAEVQLPAAGLLKAFKR